MKGTGPSKEKVNERNAARRQYKHRNRDSDQERNKQDD